MRLLYNPKHVGDKVQAWRSFLLGSMFASSLIYFATTDDIIVFLVTLGMMAASIVLSIFNNMHFTKHSFLFQNIFCAGIGVIASLVFNLEGFLLLYLGIIVILVLVTWLHQYRIKGKEETKSGEKTEEYAEKK